MSTPTPMSPPPPLPPHTHCCLSITPPSSLPSTTTNASTPPHPSISATTAEVIEQWHLSCTAFVSETRMQPRDAALPTPTASKAQYCARMRSVREIPCKAMPKNRQFGSNDRSPPATTADTSVCGQESRHPTASIPSKAMPDGLKRFRASKAPRPQDHSRASSAGALPARISFPIDLEEEDQR